MTPGEKFKDSLHDVERDENGIVVLSPYGFKTAVIDGKKYVVCLTKEEYLDILGEEIKALGDIGSCYAATGYCIQSTCTRYCEGRWSGGSYVCVCSYT